MAEQKAEEAQNAGAAEPKSSKSSLLLILVIVNMVVVVAVGAMVYMSRQKDGDSATIDKVIQGAAMEHQGASIADADFIGQLIPLESFLVNLSGTRGNKLLKVSMELEIDGEQLREEIDKRKPQIRDIIIILLSSKTYAQVSSTEGKESLREEIRNTLNSFLTRGKIKRVLFTEFIFN